MNGQHELLPTSADSYGRHSLLHARGPRVGELIARFTRSGRPLRLAWRGEEREPQPKARTEFPTGVLPVVSPLDDQRDQNVDDERTDKDTEPSSVVREGWWWLGRRDLEFRRVVVAG